MIRTLYEKKPLCGIQWDGREETFREIRAVLIGLTWAVQIEKVMLWNGIIKIYTHDPAVVATGLGSGDDIDKLYPGYWLVYGSNDDIFTVKPGENLAGEFIIA